MERRRGLVCGAHAQRAVASVRRPQGSMRFVIPHSALLAVTALALWLGWRLHSGYLVDLSEGYAVLGTLLAARHVWA